jgi:hypothetical protein
VVVPRIGTPRVLSLPVFVAPQGPARTLWVSALSGSDTTGAGSQSAPFATIGRASSALGTSGGIAYLTPGSYELTPANTAVSNVRWITVAAAPGLDPAQVQLTRSTGSGGANVKLLRLQGLTIRPGSGTNTPVQGNSGLSGKELWLDRVVVQGPGRYANSQQQLWSYASQGGFAHAYVTGCDLADFPNAFPMADLVRGCRITRIAADAYQNCRCVVNSSVSDEDPGATSSHPDVYQLDGGSFADLIGYNVTATASIKAQGIFWCAGSVTNAALVNCRLTVTNGRLFTLGGPPNAVTGHHVNEYFAGNVFDATPGSAYRSPSFDVIRCTDVVFEGARAQFPSGSLPPAPAGVVYR